jgi:hypothetical protein
LSESFPCAGVLAQLDFTPDGTGKPTPSAAGRYCDDVAVFVKREFDAGTRVSQRIRIAAPRPLAAMTTREGIKAHIEMLAGIRRHFESA